MKDYSQSFYITQNHGNNAFSYDIRQHKKLFVPALKNIQNFYEIELGDEIVFSDYDFDGNLIEAKWLKNFYEFERFWKKMYLFDNHNHALYFWYLARNQGKIGNNNLLIHIDEHSDMRDPENYIYQEETQDLEKVFDYVNFTLNVGNYIIPAQKEGIVWEVFQVRNETNLYEYLENFWKSFEKHSGIICNIDLDFFEPGLDFIDYDLKMKVVRDAIAKSDIVTFATSPFFIDQEWALQVFFDIFWEKK